MTAPVPTPADTVAEIEEEVRLAVVMYGGSSLAIYINGVAQELFHLVRSTATDPGNENLLYLGDALPAGQPSDDVKMISSTESVYRDLGRYSRRGNGDSTRSGPVRTRFVVDILSGTSAGGINSVFLGKALANDQDFQVLKNLWVQNGGLDKLLNDRQTVTSLNDPRITYAQPAASLLNSKRMYCLIYDAIRSMETSAPSVANKDSPYFDELDLYLTRTDIYGQPIPVTLSNNTVVKDLQYRDFLRFSYTVRMEQDLKSTPNSPILKEQVINDFLGENDRFLAYAARCTSAFPFAFEPMALQDVQTLAPYVSDKVSTAKQKFDEDVERWFSSFSHELDASGPQAREHFLNRPFTDGGVLDNKPFKYATDTLRRRWSNKDVRRKLIYIEPSPQVLPETDTLNLSKPDALDMVFRALVGLPGYQSIHGELQRVIERNAVIAKLKVVLDEVQAHTPNDEELDEWAGAWRTGQQETEDKDSASLRAERFNHVLQQRGPMYRAYHRLKVESVTDDLTNVVARKLGIAMNSTEYSKLRDYLAEWRTQSYPLGLEGDFLTHFDLDYRLRRLLFLRTKIDEINRAAEAAHLRTPSDGAAAEPMPGARAALRDTFMVLRTAAYDITRRNLEDGIGILECLRESMAEDAVSPEHASPLVLDADTLRHEFDPLLLRIRDDIRSATLQASAAVRRVCKENPELSKYSRFYELYDSVIFPSLYSTGIGELTHVDILRISPLDVNNSERPQDKLAGTKLGNFGALLQLPWRSNDIMWGRLDGAECLIRDFAMDFGLSAAEIAQKITEVQRIIVQEELLDSDRVAITNWLARTLPMLELEDRTPKKLVELLKDQDPDGRLPDLTPVFEYCTEADDLLKYLKTEFELPDLPRSTELQLAARSAAVVGSILDAAANSRELKQPATGLIVRATQLIAGLVEVAIPNGGWKRLAGHWLKLLYLFEGLAIGGGTLLASQSAITFGWGLLGITIAVHLTITGLRAYIRGSSKNKILACICLILGLGLLGLTGFGGYRLGVYSARKGDPVTSIRKALRID